MNLTTGPPAQEPFEIHVKEQRSTMLAYLKAVYGADHNDAEDAIQDACASALKHVLKHGWESIEHPKAWLLSAVRNAYTKADKKNNRFPLLRTSKPSSEPADPKADVRLTDQTVDVHAALRRIPKERREVMYLYFLGFRRAEIADALGLRMTKVRDEVDAGRRRLKRELKHYQEGADFE